MKSLPISGRFPKEARIVILGLILCTLQISLVSSIHTLFLHPYAFIWDSLERARFGEDLIIY